MSLLKVVSLLLTSHRKINFRSRTMARRISMKDTHDCVCMCMYTYMLVNTGKHDYFLSERLSCRRRAWTAKRRFDVVLALVVVAREGTILFFQRLLPERPSVKGIVYTEDSAGSRIKTNFDRVGSSTTFLYEATTTCLEVLKQLHSSLPFTTKLIRVVDCRFNARHLNGEK